jgi:RNA polymerase sigma-70 factor (ECF subfamily)
MAEAKIRERQPDSVLLSQVREDPGGPAGRRAASELLSRYQDHVYAWCYRHLGDHERALDLAQEVMLSAFRGLAAFKGASQFTSWLFAIARNRCISELRRPVLLLDADADVDGLESRGDDPAQALVRKMDEQAVLDLIKAHLKPREQDVLWLRCFERMPVDTITTVLKIRQASGARGVLQGARRKLRAALEQRRRMEVGGHR